MKKATITQAKNNLSAYIDLVKQGETVIITDRNRPVAKLEPMTPIDDPDGTIERLERAGILRRSKLPPESVLEILSLPPIKSKASLVDAVIEERRENW